VYRRKFSRPEEERRGTKVKGEEGESHWKMARLSIRRESTIFWTLYHWREEGGFFPRQNE